MKRLKEAEKARDEYRNRVDELNILLTELRNDNQRLNAELSQNKVQLNDALDKNALLTRENKQLSGRGFSELLLFLDTVIALFIYIKQRISLMN